MKITSRLKTRWKAITAAALLIVAVLMLLPHLLYESVDLPPGTNIASPSLPVAGNDIRLLIDDTAWDAEAGRRVINQEIFDEILSMIQRADQFIYIDLFLWNPWQGSIPEQHRELSTQLANALIKKKRSQRDVDIIALTDPINRIYGGHEPEYFKDMAKAGIPVVFTDLSKLPDSNTLYAPYWSFIEKILHTPLFNSWSSRPRFSNPFDDEGKDISALQMGRMLQFKANHRKVIITGSTRNGLEMLVGSLNPADGSSAHSNLALLIKRGPVLDALKTELSALRWCIERKRNVIVGVTSMAAYKAESIERKAERITSSPHTTSEGPLVQWLTEGAIADTIIELLEGVNSGDEIRIAMFYLSERRIVQALKGAAARGASVRVVMDANRDAFGMRKIGVPNRPVAAELMELSPDHDLKIRWADTHGEQFHTKAMSIVYKETGDKMLITGSANWTRRNVADLNMEANLVIRNADRTATLFNEYFDRIWTNSDGLSHTLPYEAWEEKGLKLLTKSLIYRFQEGWGAGTF